MKKQSLFIFTLLTTFFFSCQVTKESDIIGEYTCTQGGIKLIIESNYSYKCTHYNGDLIHSGGWSYYSKGWTFVNFTNWEDHSPCTVCRCKSDCDCTMVFNDGTLSLEPDDPLIFFTKD